MKTRRKPSEEKGRAGAARQGLLFIPDISGFTRLVRSTDVHTGQRITFELLSVLLEQNRIGLQLAEVEGDALLFYRFGPPPRLEELLRQCVVMRRAFDRKLRELQPSVAQALSLSLKVIAHYGPMIRFEIGGFRKLYGEVVIEAHRLLKNEVAGDSYLLLTDSLHEAMKDTRQEQKAGSHSPFQILCEAYSGLRKICFSCFDFRRTAGPALAA
ncbi:MAG TPA: DUF2652 domain-containing protein [Chitinophagaceae bacterium]|jgi:class 3 adenylate cyclase|nr:DUF2652 domain-containing protein [Chitinophagaceae bacterium]